MERIILEILLEDSKRYPMELVIVVLSYNLKALRDLDNEVIYLSFCNRCHTNFCAVPLNILHYVIVILKINPYWIYLFFAIAKIFNFVLLLIHSYFCVKIESNCKFVIFIEKFARIYQF